MCTGFNGKATRKEIHKERGLLGDQGVDRRMGSELILGRLAGVVWSGCSWLKIGSCKYGDEPSGSGAAE
jgi:hypothetical protein